MTIFDAIAGALHHLRRGDELIERLAPAIAEAHAIVRIAILLVLMHSEGGVFRSFSVRLHHDDRGEGRHIEGGIGRPVSATVHTSLRFATISRKQPTLVIS